LAAPQEQSFFVPLHYEPNYAYPLLVWLHGPSDGHRQVKQVMPHVSLRNYVAVAPASAEGQGTSDGFAQHPWQQHATGITSALHRVQEAIEQASERFHIADGRVFLAGFDVGGTMALRLALAAPGLFAGVASLGGPFPEGNQPLGNLLQARQLPVMIAHGCDSQRYPVSRVCEELRLFHVAGLSLHVRQYPCGHELTTQMLSDLDAWIMERVTGASCASSPACRQSPGDELN
jgi:phospholipase/carboxylesterase